MPDANRLAAEISPYLLQHQHNPVDWWPWSDEAFAEARRRNVPVFLSVGYATCYWCHVMERESFESDQTATVMNEHFVNIKLDREQHPEVDEIYMAATQILTGGGGWPMSVFLEPELRRPFYAGTYFPKSPRHGLPSFNQLLLGMSNAWKDNHADVIDQANKLAAAVESHTAERPDPVAITSAPVAAAVGQLIQQHDQTNGGFGGAPKFPQPVYLSFLLDALDVVDESTRTAAKSVLIKTLDAMEAGGLHDHVGGGFHRYCVDATWTVPHFEKMLYDNAQLLEIYARAADLFPERSHRYRRAATRTLDWIEREMTSPEGGFYSAQDAEVDAREGLSYLWTEAPMREVLSSDDADFAISAYGLDAGTNFQDPHHPDDPPANVLRLDASESHDSGFYERLDSVNAHLLGGRAGRKQPITDDKLIAGWNGLFCAACARAAGVLQDDRALTMALRAAEAVTKNVRTEDGDVARSFRAGRAHGAGGLEDHAALICAHTALHRAGAEGALDTAKQLAERAHELLGGGDADGDGYFDSVGGRSDLFVRPRSTYDGAVPSGGSIMLHALIDLAALDPDGPWQDRALGQLKSVSGIVADRPVSIIESTRAVLRFLRTPGVGEAGLAFGPVPVEADASADVSPVEVYADTERVSVAPGRPGSFRVVLRVAPGYHVLAAEPAAEGSDVAEGLVPLRVGLVSGQGVAVYADYPEGEPYGSEFVGSDELRVHVGDVEFEVALEHADGVGASEGDPVLGITFQVCTDTACLEPMTFELDVAVDLV